ncbi:MAG TPA: NAD-dependent epimerase/dehydratase family protein [Blastocatellia bacterium]|nr:NAD-dependent epimerase/dehydratase family protein [Blastocatellia bacterium]
MTTALIGFSGFVGSSLDCQATFDDRYNSANISEVRGRSYDLIVCAAAPAVKWLANQKPEEDLDNLRMLMGHLKKVSAARFLLISTVDVYRTPREVNEDTPIDPLQVEPYGRHRYYLEEFVRENFSQVSIVRLPGLFGLGLKKNLIYDLINNNCLHLTHCESVFQFYNLKHLWSDLQTVIRHSLPVVNFSTEPVCAREVALKCFGRAFDNLTEKSPVAYDMRSKYAHLFGSRTGYLYSAEQVTEEIRLFGIAQLKARTV